MFGLGALKAKLTKTHNAIMGRVESALGKASRAETIETLEESLIAADVGAAAAMEITEKLREEHFSWNSDGFRAALRDSLYETLRKVESPLSLPSNGPSPFVIMVLGVNGVGKTTTIGKLAARFTEAGKTVIIGAGDTFRAAAIEQLDVWGKRARADVIKHAHGGDPGAVAFDAVKSAIARKADVLILDTAGRLHTKTNLMEELKKVQRVISRELPGAPHENLMVVDGSTGQNAINQLRLFNEAVGVTGMAVTKLDGTAKGGVLVPLAKEFGIPIRLIGVGEGVEDLKDFNAREFVEALV